MGQLFHCNTGALTKNELHLPCSVLVSDNYVILGIGTHRAKPLQCTVKKSTQTLLVHRSRRRFVLINLPITKYRKECLRRSCKGIKIMSCCCIQVLAVFVIIEQSFSVVTKPVTTVNDQTTVILSPVYVQEDIPSKTVLDHHKLPLLQCQKVIPVQQNQTLRYYLLKIFW